MGRSKHDTKSKGHFAGVPSVVMAHPDYTKLNFSARALLFELANQLYKTNNGKLCAVHSQLKSRGWKSDTTLRNNVKELMNANMIVLTKAGVYGGKSTPNYYAVTWRQIDNITGFYMDVEPTSKPVRQFTRELRLVNKVA
ncbi:MAG: hypothetical protein ACJAW1_003267 [Glaciecola sp.]|jgi:hypothetical protein